MEIGNIKNNVVCPVELTLRILGGKWRGSILYQLREEPLRFNELMRRVQDAVVYYNDEDHFLTGKVLAEHLLLLQEYKLVEKKLLVEGEKEIYKYALTEKGKSVIPILLDLYHWGETNF